jgi:hypothetical protein
LRRIKARLEQALQEARTSSKQGLRVPPREQKMRGSRDSHALACPPWPNTLTSAAAVEPFGDSLSEGR